MGVEIVSFRRVFAGIIFAAPFLIFTTCSEKKDESNGITNREGTSKDTAPIHALLDTGLIYELPVAVTLYPQKGMDTASVDSLNPLIVLPIGTKFGVFKRDLVGKTPWYTVMVFSGPHGGWKDVAGYPLDSIEILTYMAKNRGIPGWINHRDIEGLPMRYTPYPRAENTKGKKRQE